MDRRVTHAYSAQSVAHGRAQVRQGLVEAVGSGLVRQAEREGRWLAAAALRLVAATIDPNSLSLGAGGGGRSKYESEQTVIPIAWGVIKAAARAVAAARCLAEQPGQDFRDTDRWRAAHTVARTEQAARMHAVLSGRDA
jgi:hypothetical protein